MGVQQRCRPLRHRVGTGCEGHSEHIEFNAALLGREGTVAVISAQPNRRQRKSWMPGPGYPIDKDDGAYNVHSCITLETIIKHST